MPRLLFIVWTSLWLLGLGLWTAERSLAQAFISGPSTSLDDAKSLLRNPALVSFQRSKLALGAKGHYLGLGEAGGIPLRQGFVTISTPYLIGDRIGLGGHVQYFDSPALSKMAAGVTVSGRILRFLSAGVQVSTLTLSYDEGSFFFLDDGSGDVDPRADPVFAGGTGKTTFTTALGLFAQPLPGLGVALGVRHLNRPNLALGEVAAREEPVLFGGVSYALGPMRLYAEVENGRYGLTPRLAAEVFAVSGSYVRLGSDVGLEAPRVEAQLHVGGPLSINYNYSLPMTDLQGVTSGSHQFALVFEFGRAPSLPMPVALPPMYLANEDAGLEPVLPARSYVAVENAFLNHLEKRLTRHIDEGVDPEALRSLTPEDLGQLDSSLVVRPAQADGRPLRQVPDDVLLIDPISPTYEETIQALSDVLGEDPRLSLSITGEGNEVVKAIGVRNRLIHSQVRPGQVRVAADSLPDERHAVDLSTLPAQEVVTLLYPATTTVYLMTANTGTDNRSWAVRITADDGEVVKAFQGTGAIPASIEWDWRTDAGQALPGGTYALQLVWEDAAGQQHASNTVPLTAHQVIRTMTIEVTQDPSRLREPADAMELRIRSDRR